jgi:hypothetical protein
MIHTWMKPLKGPVKPNRGTDHRRRVPQVFGYHVPWGTRAIIGIVLPPMAGKSLDNPIRIKSESLVVCLSPKEDVDQIIN